jgi:hypothetical protein
VCQHYVSSVHILTRYLPESGDTVRPFWKHEIPPHACHFVTVEYSGDMFSGTFTGIRLDASIRAIHDAIVNVWNFNPPNQAHLALLATVVRTNRILRCSVYTREDSEA